MREGGGVRSVKSRRQTLTEVRPPMNINRLQFLAFFLFPPSFVSKIETNYEQHLRNRTILGSHHYPT